MKLKLCLVYNTVSGLIVLLFIIISGRQTYAQNTSEGIYDAHAVTDVVVNGNQIFNIDVSTTKPFDAIVLIAKLDGEYQNNYNIVSYLDGKILNVAMQPMGIEAIEDDKRNAHKVIAATLQITLPEYKNISISSDIGFVTLNGHFDTVAVDLRQGNFKAQGTVKKAHVKTIDGSIEVVTEDAIVNTDSHHGLVSIPNNLVGFGLWQLKTHGGNITVTTLD